MPQPERQNAWTIDDQKFASHLQKKQSLLNYITVAKPTKFGSKIRVH